MKDRKLRKTGIEVIGDAPWGTHFCLFYHTKKDLIDILVPYFKVGLENNEFCMWVTSEPLNVEDARRSLESVVEDLDEYIEQGQIEILDYSQWYTKSGRFDADEVLQGWVEKEAQAVKRGFDGLRLTGNTFWLEERDWEAFTNYEATVDSVIGQNRMLAICTYSLDRCEVAEVLDVMSNHLFALIKREGEWEIIESAERKRAEEKIRILAAIVSEAKVPIAMVDMDGMIAIWNKSCEEMLGYSAEETVGRIPMTKICPGADEQIQITLRESHRIDQELDYVAKDGRVIPASTSTFLVNDETGTRIGVAGIAIDITERKRAEEALRHRAEEMAALVEMNRAIAIQNARLFEAEREQRELSQALEKAAAAISSTLDLDELLDHILGQVERVVAGDAFSVILIEDEVARLARWRGYELQGEEMQPSRFDISMAKYPHLMKMARTGKPIIVPDTSLDPDWVPAVRDQAGWRRSYIGVPIRLGDKTAGFLSASGTQPGQFGPEDARRMEALASHAAAAIGNARLYRAIQQKAEELALLLDTTTAVSSTLELDRVLRTLAEKMTASVGATFCRIALLDEMNQTLTIRAAFAAHDLSWDPGLGWQYALADAPWHRQVIERRDIVILRQDDPSQAMSETECRITLSEGIQSALLIPLVMGERTLGVVSLGEVRSWERLPFTADRVRLCQAMANQAAIAIENARLLDAVSKHSRDLQRLSVQLLSAQEEERRRLSLELHDELGQALTAISFNLAAIEKELPPELGPRIREILAETNSLVNEIDDQVRELGLDLRPYMLDDLGLVPALRWYVNRYAKRLNIEVEMEAIDFEERVTPQVETALYRVVQEALTNVSRHAQANRVSIRLERKESAVIALIEDDGQGFDVGKIESPYPLERGAGLLGIRERVTSLGGTFHIQSHPGEGTRLTIEIPV